MILAFARAMRAAGWRYRRLGKCRALFVRTRRIDGRLASASVLVDLAAVERSTVSAAVMAERLIERGEASFPRLATV